MIFDCLNTSASCGVFFDNQFAFNISNFVIYFLFKNRNGPDGIVYPIFMDTSNVKIKVLPKTGETANDIIQKSSAERLANLKEKYKVFKKEGGKK